MLPGVLAPGNVVSDGSNRQRGSLVSHFIAGVHHVALIVSNYEISKGFYTETLGFPVVAETFRAERNSWKLDLSIPGGGQLELFTFPEPPSRPSTPEACGLRHLAFGVFDLDTTVLTLGQRGVECEPIRIDPITECRFTFFKDPDDLPIELYEQLK